MRTILRIQRELASSEAGVVQLRKAAAAYAATALGPASALAFVPSQADLLCIASSGSAPKLSNRRYPAHNSCLMPAFDSERPVILRIEAPLRDSLAQDFAAAGFQKVLAACVRPRKGAFLALAVAKEGNESFTRSDLSVFHLLAETLQLALDIAEARERDYENTTALQIAGAIARLGAWRLNIHDRRLLWSDEVCRIHGVPVGETPGVRTALQFYLPRWRSMVRKSIRDCVRYGRPFDYEAEIATTAGEKIWVRSIGRPVQNREGKVLEIVGAFQDISASKQAEQLLRDQASMLDRAPAAIIVRDLKHRILYWNRTAEMLYGYTLAEVKGQPAPLLLNYDDSTFGNAFRECLREGEWSGEFVQRTKENKAITVFARWTLLFNRDGVPERILAINNDITEHKRSEERARHAQRLESIGTLPGGIAHDLNNVLTPILISAEMLGQSVNTEEDRESLRIIRDCAKRGAGLLAQVLAFARGAPASDRRELQAQRIVSGVERIVRETFPPNIALTVDCPPDTHPILGDALQLDQVLLNLCVNARDAMPQGGKLHIECSNTEAPVDAPSKKSLTGAFVCISVQDTGCGMTAEILEKIFDPFFTTKEAGRGTGLGLSTSLRIVHDHRGFIRVYSEVDRGTRVNVYLPAAQGAAAHTETPEPASAAGGSGEKLLLVDDEDLVRSSIAQWLRRSGYQVITATDADQALALFREFGDEIRVVITDILMPGRDGIELIQEIQSAGASVPIIAASGFMDQERREQLAAAGVFAVLAKPLPPDELLTAIRKALAAAGDGR